MPIDPSRVSWDPAPAQDGLRPIGPPGPRLAGQVLGQDLQNTKNQQDIANNPLSRENMQVNVEQGRNAISNTAFQHKDTLRTEFQALPLVKNYNTVSQKIGGALTAPDNAQGDLAVLYAFATVMDPNSVVRESEQEMAKSTGSTIAQLQQKYNMVTEGARLPPGVRNGLLETMRENYKFLNSVYDQTRGQYSDLAKRNGFDPTEIIGPSAVHMVQGPEADYVRAHGGNPKVNGVPLAAPTEYVGGFADELPRQDPEPPHAEDFRNGLYGAMRSGQIRSLNDMRAWTQQFNRQNETLFNVDMTGKETFQAIRAARQGKKFNVELPKFTPNIKDVRGQSGDVRQAHGRGAADVMTFGTLDKLQAGTDTLFKGGTMAENLARQYAITDYDAENHPLARASGQVLGGLGTPMGEMGTLPQIVGKGAAMGAAYGVGSSRSLSDVPQNALLGGASGAAIGGAVGGVARGVSALRTPRDIPALVDGATGELNQPLDAMTPAQRRAEFDNFGLNTVTPGMAGGRSARVIEQGFNNLPGSAGVMEDVNSAASGELRKSMSGVADKFGSSRTLNEGGAELQRGAAERIERGKVTIGKAYDAIPIAPDAPTSNASSLATLKELTGRFQSNPDLAETMLDPKLASYLGAIEKGGLSWQDLKQFRSVIGEKIGDVRFGEGHSTKDLRALYGALSEDMKTTASSMGPRAARAFERANTLNRQNEQLVQGALTRILGKDGQQAPERAAAIVQAMTQGGKSTGDLKTLAQVKAATVKSGAWDEIASTLIRLGGQPAKSEGRAFQPATFVNWYADMSESARAMLFKPELRKELDRFVAINQQLGRVRGLNNTSGTTPTMIGSGVLAAGGVAAISHPSALLALIGGGIVNNVMARAWTNPKFVNLITGYSRAAISGSSAAAKSQVGRLQKLAATNPELREPIERVLKTVANENFTSSVAASGADQRQDDKQ